MPNQSPHAYKYSKTCLKRPLKNRQNKDLNDKWKLHAGLKYCRMLPLEHSVILLTCIKRQSVLKKNLVFILSDRLRQVYCTHIYQNLYMFNPTSLYNNVLYRFDKYIYGKIKASIKTFTILYCYILVCILCNATDKTSRKVTVVCILVVSMLKMNGFLM